MGRYNCSCICCNKCHCGPSEMAQVSSFIGSLIPFNSFNDVWSCNRWCSRPCILYMLNFLPQKWRHTRFNLVLVVAISDLACHPCCALSSTSASSRVCLFESVIICKPIELNVLVFLDNLNTYAHILEYSHSWRIVSWSVMVVWQIAWGNRSGDLINNQRSGTIVVVYAIVLSLPLTTLMPSFRCYQKCVQSKIRVHIFTSFMSWVLRASCICDLLSKPKKYDWVISDFVTFQLLSNRATARWFQTLNWECKQCIGILLFLSLQHLHYFIR